MLPFFRKFHRHQTSHRSVDDHEPTNSSDIVRTTKESTVPTGSSAGAKGAIAAFKSALQLLGSAPLPGINVVTQALLGIVNGIEGISQAETGWKELAERTQRLWFLVSQLQTIDGQHDDICISLINELNQLADDVKRASTQGTLLAFFNGTGDKSSINEHRMKMDSIIIDMTVFICAATQRTAAQILEEYRMSISNITSTSRVHGDTYNGTISNSNAGGQRNVNYLTNNSYGNSGQG